MLFNMKYILIYLQITQMKIWKKGHFLLILQYEKEMILHYIRFLLQG